MMTSLTFYPTSITQASSTTSNHYKQWGDLNNLKTSSGSARCGPRNVSNAYIAGKNGTYRRPSALTIKGFNFSSIPTNADIDSIVIEYAQSKGAYSGGAYPSFTGPTFTVNGGGKKLASKTGSTVTSSSTSHSFTVTGLNRNSLDNFSIKVEYPTNSSTNPGYVYLSYVRVKVNYTLPSYSVNATIDTLEDIRLDDRFNASFIITNKNKTSYNPNATITIPTGLTFTGKYTGNGTITSNGNTLTWKTGLSKTNLQSKITLEIEASSVGSKTLTIGESVSGSSKSVGVIVKNKPLNVTVTGPSSNLIKSDEIVNATIDVISTETFVNTDSIDILVNGINNTVGFVEDDTPITITGEAYTDSDGVEWIKYAYVPNVSEDLKHTLEVTVTPNEDVGVLGLRVLKDETSYDYKVNVYPSSIEQPYYAGFIVTDNERSKLCDEQLYEVSSNLFIEDTHNPPYYSDGLIDYGLNHRICVFNDEIESNATLEEMITYAYEHCTIKSDCPEQSNTWTKCSCTFTYNEDYPLIILLLGEPLSSSLHPSEINLQFTNPCIQEVTNDVMNYQEVGNFPEEFINIISEDVSATVTGESNTFVLADWFDLDTVETGDDIVVTGLRLSFDYPNKDDVSLLATVKSNGVTGNRSLIITSDDEEPTVTIGEDYDRWDLSFNDLTNLKDLEVSLKTDGGVFNISNPVLTVYYKEIQRTEHTCLVNGEDTRYYGLFLQDVNIPFGVNTDVNYYNVEGADINTAYRQNIKSKEIKITFSINDCNLTQSSKTLQQVTKLFMNERDTLNKPILKTIEFSHLPNEYFLYLLENSIDNSIVINDYDCTVTLVVPDGTSFNKEEKITYLTGSNDGLVKVNPIIKINNLTNTCTVTEENTHQTITINQDEESFNSKDYLEINSETRKVTLYKYNTDTEEYGTTDVTSGVDYSSTWFTLNGAYNFTSTGCKIVQVSYRERW